LFGSFQDEACTSLPLLKGCGGDEGLWVAFRDDAVTYGRSQRHVQSEQMLVVFA
jgi:hypothetical protein